MGLRFWFHSWQGFLKIIMLKETNFVLLCLLMQNSMHSFQLWDGVLFSGFLFVTFQWPWIGFYIIFFILPDNLCQRGSVSMLEAVDVRQTVAFLVENITLLTRSGSLRLVLSLATRALQDPDVSPMVIQTRWITKWESLSTIPLTRYSIFLLD